MVVLRACLVSGQSRLKLDQGQAFERVHRDIERRRFAAATAATAADRMNKRSGLASVAPPAIDARSSAASASPVTSSMGSPSNCSGAEPGKSALFSLA